MNQPGVEERIEWCERQIDAHLRTHNSVYATKYELQKLEQVTKLLTFGIVCYGLSLLLHYTQEFNVGAN